MIVPTADPPVPLREIRTLTAARGIAAWWVVLYHIRGSVPGLPPIAEGVLAKGYLAVDFFFLLSGFVIWLAWCERLRSGGAAAIPAFLVKRIARIWPLHAAMLLLAALLALTLQISGRTDPDFPWAQLPANLLLVQNWGWTDRLTWNDPAWSISVECAAYLVFPALVLTVDWRRVATLPLIGVAAAMLATLFLAMRHRAGLGADIPHFGLVRCLCEFGCGTILAALFLRARGKRVGPAIPFGVAIALGIAWFAGMTETLVLPACFAALLLGLALMPGGDTPAGRPIHYLGEISYATYLSHFLLWKLFKLAFVGDMAAISGWQIAAYLALVLAASILLYHRLERPAQRWVERRAARWISRRVPPPVRRSAPQ